MQLCTVGVTEIKWRWSTTAHDCTQAQCTEQLVDSNLRPYRLKSASSEPLRMWKSKKWSSRVGSVLLVQSRYLGSVGYIWYNQKADVSVLPLRFAACLVVRLGPCVGPAQSHLSVRRKQKNQWVKSNLVTTNFSQQPMSETHHHDDPDTFQKAFV